MTRALDVVEDYLAWRAFPCLRMDGGTAAAERGDLVARFNDPGGWLGGLVACCGLRQGHTDGGSTGSMQMWPRHSCMPLHWHPASQPTAALLPGP
jgi:hypothetical protein